MNTLQEKIQLYTRRKSVSEETIKELKKLNIGGIVLDYHEKMNGMIHDFIEDLKEIREDNYGK